MADKVIINGVDVSGCGFFHPEFKDTDCHIALAFSDQYEGCIKCKSNPNCYYKRLQYKKQECEDLKEELKTNQQFVNDSYIESSKICKNLDRYKQALEKIEEILKHYAYTTLGIKESDGTFSFKMPQTPIILKYDPRKAQEGLDIINEVKDE